MWRHGSGEEPLILREEGSGTRKETARLPFPDGDRYGRVLYCGCHGESGDRSNVLSGAGWGSLSWSGLAAEDDVRAGKLLEFPLGAEGGSRSVNLVFDAAYPVLPAADKLIRKVKELYKVKEIYKEKRPVR